MTFFFEYLEMSRPTAAVAKKTAGSNAGAPAVFCVLGLTGLGLGVRDITASSTQAGAQLSLSHRAWDAAAGDTTMYGSGHKSPRPEIAVPNAESDLFGSV